MNDRQKLVRMYENLLQEIKTAENNILFFTGKSKSANKLVDDMQKKIDELKTQLIDIETKINQMDAE
jgi:phage shock protein A